MRLSRYLTATLRDDPKEAETISHRLMLRAGMIRQLAAGIYDLLPTGVRAIRRVEQIVREEMNRAGALEVELPVVQPAELWRESRRWDAYGKELLRLRDRHDREFVLGPTHEEVITDLVRRTVSSYKQLPVNLYQIHTKFRDEVRPRFGLMRGREFTMKDAYSFHADESSLDEEYETMVAAYRRIFSRCGLDFRAVEADTGSIGGSASHEFMVLADSGEDAVASCTSCLYAANVEKAEFGRGPVADVVEPPTAQRIATPGKRSIDEVAEFLAIRPEQMLKTLAFDSSLGPVVAVVRGDLEIAEAKVRAVLGADWALLLEAGEIAARFGVPVGFMGPVGLPSDVRLLLDHSVATVRDGVTGANESDAHLVHVLPGRDFALDGTVDIAEAVAGAPCPRCSEGSLRIHRGIEVGHVFKLGRKYSEALQATFLDPQGVTQTMTMGCYGIGIGRTAAAAIEQNHDERGIIWPVPLAPFSAVVVPLDGRHAELSAAAEGIYLSLLAQGFDVALDDRDERPGVKFTDAELIGIPFRIVLGRKGFERGVAELVRRRGGEAVDVPLDQVAAVVAAEIATGLRAGNTN
jgi:prolyl-tRNA synthetase